MLIIFLIDFVAGKYLRSPKACIAAILVSKVLSSSPDINIFPNVVSFVEPMAIAKYERTRGSS
ncbi:uncharacterized protein METZ01_LOCUS55294 [marine metagenome]|uniref:Uncharacterized protein n=1 Tax=marine metagenome TaxID=408172 RepID=A0A381SED8_9ZZZZ